MKKINIFIVRVMCIIFIASSSVEAKTCEDKMKIRHEGQSRSELLTKVMWFKSNGEIRCYYGPRSRYIENSEGVGYKEPSSSNGHWYDGLAGGDMYCRPAIPGSMDSCHFELENQMSVDRQSGG